MGKDKKIFKKGAVIRNKNKNQSGIVIDWGTVISLKRGYDGGYKEFMLPSKELIDSIRVRTNEGGVEIWPTEVVESARAL